MSWDIKYSPIPASPANAVAWWLATADKQWVAPMNNSAAISAGKSWVGDTNVVDPLALSTNDGSCGDVSGIYDAYCGMTPDRQRNQGMTMGQGGHCNYYGNEANWFDLMVESPMWTRLKDADASNTPRTTDYVFWSNGNPSSSHSYSQDICVNGRWLAFGRSAVNYLGGSSNTVCVEFDKTGNTWINQGNILDNNQYPGNAIPLYIPSVDRIVRIHGAGGNSYSSGTEIINPSTLATVSSSSANFEDGGELVGSYDTTHGIALVRGSAGWWWSKGTSFSSWNSITPTGSTVPSKHGFDWHPASGAFLTYVFGTGLLKGVPTVDGSGNYTGIVWSVVSGTTGLTPPAYNTTGGTGLYNRVWVGSDMGDGRCPLVYVPAYEFPDVYVLAIPAAGV